MSKQRWLAAALMVALAAAAIAAPGEARQASAVATALEFSPTAIALENDGDTATVDIVVTGLEIDEADTVQINIQHSTDFDITNPSCGPLYAGGYFSTAIAVDGGTAFICTVQNGPVVGPGGTVASFDIMKVGDTTGLETLTFLDTGSFKTTFFEAGSEVSPGTLGSLAVWDLLEDVTNKLVAEDDAPLVFDVTSTLTGTLLSLSHTVTAGSPAVGLIGFVNNGDNTGTFTITPGFDDAGVYTIEVAADNGTVTGIETFELTVTDVNRAPVLVVIDPDPQSVFEGATLNVPLSASDLDLDGLALTATIQKGAGPIIAIPDGVFSTITDNGDGTGSLDFNPGFTDAGTYTVVVTVTDDSTAPNGVLNDSDTFTLTVNDANQNPVVTPIDDADIDEGALVALVVPIAATDADLDPILLSATIQKGAGPVVAFADSVFSTIIDNLNGTGTLTFAPNFGDAGIYTIVVTADAGVGGTGTDTFVLTVNDVPSIMAPAGTVKLQGVWDSLAPQVDRESWFANVAPLVELIRVSDGLVEASMTVNDDGSFAFNNVPTTTNYRLRISADGYFTHVLGSSPADEIDMTLGDFDLGPLAANKPVTMLGGLVIPGSTVVEGSAVSAVLGSFSLATPLRVDTFGNVVDINGDLVVTAADVSIAISNMGLFGDQLWL